LPLSSRHSIFAGIKVSNENLKDELSPGMLKINGPFLYVVMPMWLSSSAELFFLIYAKSTGEKPRV